MRRSALFPLITHPISASEAVAARAAAMASLLGADLHALGVTADLPPVTNAFARVMVNVPAMIKEAEAASRSRAQALLDVAEAEGRRWSLKVSRETVAAEPPLVGDVVAEKGRYHDVVLVGLEAANPTTRMMAEVAIFAAGRPVILLPERDAPAALGHVAVAWDGSRVAARALADAAPILEKAQRVSVLTVVDEKPLDETDLASRLAAVLRARGLAAEAVPVIAEDQAIALTLQARAQERGADLMVMGAYGHSRLRDFVLGGATQGVLDRLSLPVLLSH